MMHARAARATRGNIYFVRTRDEFGRLSHYFLQVAPAREQQFRKAMGGRTLVDYAQYGTILASGFGHSPSDETVKMLKDKYQYDV